MNPAIATKIASTNMDHCMPFFRTGGIRLRLGFPLSQTVHFIASVPRVRSTAPPRSTTPETSSSKSWLDCGNCKVKQRFPVACTAIPRDVNVSSTYCFSCAQRSSEVLGVPSSSIFLSVGLKSTIRKPLLVGPRPQWLSIPGPCIRLSNKRHSSSQC